MGGDQFGDGVATNALDGVHGAVGLFGQSLHDATTGSHGAEHILHAQHAGGEERGELANAVPGHGSYRRLATLAQRHQTGDVDAGDRHLLVLGLVQLGHRPLAAQAAQVEAGDVAGAVPDSRGGGILVADLLTHADMLGTLPRKQQGNTLVTRSLEHLHNPPRCFPIDRIHCYPDHPDNRHRHTLRMFSSTATRSAD